LFFNLYSSGVSPEFTLLDVVCIRLSAKFSSDEVVFISSSVVIISGFILSI